jgi:hypothetical protein
MMRVLTMELLLSSLNFDVQHLNRREGRRQTGGRKDEEVAGGVEARRPCNGLRRTA